MSVLSRPSHGRGVFFVKCRPQGADIIEIVRKWRRAFVGYPPWKKGASYNPSNLSACIVDFSQPNDDWDDQIDESEYHRSMASNRRFAKDVKAGWIAMIPRPGDGLCWLSEVTGPFELTDAPPWREEYLKLRRESGLDIRNEQSHVGDIAQSWPLSPLQKVPFARVPRWISYRLLSRPTIGEIEGFLDLELDPYDTLKSLMDGSAAEVPAETGDTAEIERRLLTYVSPSAFEHLCVSLLQLEHPGDMWWHTGGSGDGGADGQGYSSNWEFTGVLQCKWHYSGKSLSDGWAGALPLGCRRHVLASLIHGEVQIDINTGEFWGRKRIAELVKKHARKVPLAKTLRVISD